MPPEPDLTADCPNCRGLQRRLDQLESGMARLQAFMNIAQRGLTADPSERALLLAEIHLLEIDVE